MQCYSATGRFCNDPKFTEANGKKRATFLLAVRRTYKKEGFPEADFIPCIVYGERAQFVYDYFKQGMRAEIEGKIQTYTYTENETTLHGFNVLLSFVDFGDPKSVNAQYQGTSNPNIAQSETNEIEREPYYDDKGFTGVDAMIECPSCHVLVPKADQCIECGMRLK